VVFYMSTLLGFMVDYGILFLATMVFFLKMSKTEGYTLGLAKKFDNKEIFNKCFNEFNINPDICFIVNTNSSYKLYSFNT